MSRFRTTKKDVRSILADADWHSRLVELDQWTPGVLVPPLFSLRLDRDEAVRWRAVTAFGLTVDRMAEASMEKARTVMRTCMWHMNEESGNLGWGIPHFMGEAMAKNEMIAKEYHKILLSYIFCDKECDGNFLEHDELRRDVFWGLARLAEIRPELVASGEKFFRVGLEEPDPYNRAYAALALGLIKSASARERLKELADDPTEIRTFRNGEIIDISVGGMARQAIGLIGG